MKIMLSRDWFNEDPSKRRRVRGLIIEIGYRCTCSMECPHYYECKYRGKWRFHNRMVDFARWMNQKFNIKFHSPIYLQQYPHHETHPMS